MGRPRSISWGAEVTFDSKCSKFALADVHAVSDASSADVRAVSDASDSSSDDGEFFDCDESDSGSVASSGDPPRSSGDIQDVASRSSEHVHESDSDPAANVAKADWDRGISKLPKPSAEQRIKQARRLRGFGCKTLMLELFAGAAILTRLALSAGWPCSPALDVLSDGLDLTVPSSRAMVDGLIEQDDPFVLILPFPCGPWNSLTEWNMSRYDHIKQRVEQTREEHKPMLEWICR